MTTPSSSAITVATLSSLQLILRAPEEEWSGIFDTIQVFRSRLTEGGPYDAMTSVTYEPAYVIGSPPLAPIVGLELVLETNGTEISVTFTGADPLTPAQVLAQILDASELLAGASTATTFTIETVQTGATAYLKVVGGDAAPLLGLETEEPGSITFGQDPFIPLVAGTESYSFVDPHSSEEYFYKIRYRSTATLAVSEYSNPFPGTPTAKLDPSHLIVGTLELADAFGRPHAFANVLVQADQQFVEKSGTYIMPIREVVTTDRRGRIEVPLVRGIKVRVAVESSGLVKELTVPTDSALSSFNLFDPTYSEEDPDKVQTPAIDYAVRRSL